MLRKKLGKAEVRKLRLLKRLKLLKIGHILYISTVGKILRGL